MNEINKITGYEIAEQGGRSLWSPYYVLHDEHLKAMSAEYKRGWDDCAKVAAEQAKARLSRKARSTSREAVHRNADSIKGVQRDVYTALTHNPLGLTDFDLEDALGRSHQSVSAARNALMMSGLVTDSGKRRPNRRGNNAIVWVVSSPSSEDADVRKPDAVSSPTGPNGGRTTATITLPNPPCPECGDKLVTNLYDFSKYGCLRCGWSG